MTTAAQLGHVQVNDTDYAGRIVIEQCIHWDGDKPCYAVPAWDEAGAYNLSGDVPEFTDYDGFGRRFQIGWSWSSRQAAERALADFLAA